MNCAVHPEIPAEAYCRTCGKALCESCKRDVMGAIYCESCLAARLRGGSPAAVPSRHGAPHPAIAAWLGLIPGVGAMYNDQFIKALIHVVIFAVLVAISHHLSSFGLVILFFELYMVFDAHKTAQARQFGWPLPDYLGLERIFGINEGAQENGGRREQPAAAATAASDPGFPGAAPAPAWGAYQKAPTGAIVLIGLGVLFLLNNFSFFDIDRLWPLFLIGLGVWLVYRRSLRQA